MAFINVLLAEDEALIRFVISEELRELGWEITEVGTADEGIRAIRRGERFDLIITDINMPGTTTGLDLAKEVRSVDPNAKIAIMTGRPAGEAADLCDLYLKKPFLEVGSLFQRLMVDAA